MRAHSSGGGRGARGSSSSARGPRAASCRGCWRRTADQTPKASLPSALSELKLSDWNEDDAQHSKRGMLAWKCDHPGWIRGLVRR
eukprot:6206515-Pleurochrysis_carterae.AAC.2